MHLHGKELSHEQTGKPALYWLVMTDEGRGIDRGLRGASDARAVE